MLIQVSAATVSLVLMYITAVCIYIYKNPLNSNPIRHELPDSFQHIHNEPPSTSPSPNPLRQFWLETNRNNLYLDSSNINDISTITNLLHRILSTSNIHESDPDLITAIISHFKFNLQPLTFCKSSDTNTGCYSISQETSDSIVTISGDSILSIISGLSYYLSTYWMVSLSWNGNNIHLLLDPEYLESVTSSIVSPINIYASRRFQYTYYKNPCTDSYSMPWWDWTRWQQELDWMVFHNINLLLLPTLNELIEYQLYSTHYGLTDDQLSGYFVGPAFLAWFRMGNLRGWPPFKRNNGDGEGRRVIGLSPHWFRSQLELTFRIMTRCIELGIDVVLPAFSGHVPSALKSKVNAHFYDGSRWFGMPDDLTSLTFIDATDPFYIEIGLKYQEIQYEILSSFFEMKHSVNTGTGTTTKQHTIFLWLDQYNELTPSSSELDYLQKSGENQFKSLQFQKYIDDGIKIKWTVQGWMFVHMRKYWSNQRIEAYFKGIGGDDILILDLIAEKGSVAADSKAFYGHDYVWCFLHNFGGGYGLSGNLGNVFKALSTASTISSQSKSDGHWKGIGISMEGIHNNPILYHAVLFHSFDVQQGINGEELEDESHSNHLSPEQSMNYFIEYFIASRYGKVIADAQNGEILKIWKSLIPLLYDSVNGKWSVTRSLIIKRPGKRMVSDPSEFEYIDHILKEKEDLGVHEKRSGFQTTSTDYDVCQLYEQWTRLIQFVRELDVKVVSESNTLANDMAEITRQFLSDLFQQIYLLLTIHSKKELEPIMLQIIDDTDEVLSYFKYFQLNLWLMSARKMGEDREEKDYLEWNARNLVTRWGPNGQINDYSSREWSGLMKGYYKKRWQAFFKGESITDVEEKWQHETINDVDRVDFHDDFALLFETLEALYQRYSKLILCRT